MTRNLSLQRTQYGAPPYLLALAPIVVLAHVAEEAPGLVAWMNRHVEPDLTMSDFFAIYLPYFVAATVTICHNFNVRPRAAVLAATMGAVPMLVQGIGILAVGRRILW